MNTYTKYGGGRSPRATVVLPSEYILEYAVLERKLLKYQQLAHNTRDNKNEQFIPRHTKECIISKSMIIMKVYNHLIKKTLEQKPQHKCKTLPPTPPKCLLHITSNNPFTLYTY